MATEKPRFSLTLDESLLGQVEDYQKEHGISTKSRAIQALLEIGLDDFMRELPAEVKEVSPSLSDAETELLSLFRRMEPLDQGRIIGRMEQILDGEKYRKESLSKDA